MELCKNSFTLIFCFQKAGSILAQAIYIYIYIYIVVIYYINHEAGFIINMCIY